MFFLSIPEQKRGRDPAAVFEQAVVQVREADFHSVGHVHTLGGQVVAREERFQPQVEHLLHRFAAGQLRTIIELVEEDPVGIAASVSFMEIRRQQTAQYALLSGKRFHDLLRQSEYAAYPYQPGRDQGHLSFGGAVCADHRSGDSKQVDERTTRAPMQSGPAEFVAGEEFVCAFTRQNGLESSLAHRAAQYEPGHAVRVGLDRLGVSHRVCEIVGAVRMGCRHDLVIGPHMAGRAAGNGFFVVVGVIEGDGEGFGGGHAPGGDPE